MRKTRKHTSFEDALEVWLLDARAARLTDRTIDFYRRSAQHFIKWAATQQLTTVEQVTALHVRQYLAHLRELGHSANYQNNLYRAVKQFFKFCVAEELIGESPFTKNVRAPRPERKELQAVTDAELRRVLRACDNRRDRALVRLLVSSGIRAAELCALNVESVDLVTGLVRVKQGKGQKDRSTFCDKSTRTALKLYLLERGDTTPGEPLFLTLRRAERLTPNTIVQIFRRLQLASKVPHVTAHALRRTFALNCLRGGMNIYVLARLMGHADIAALERYLPLTGQDIEDEYSRRGPKEV
jgi:integrase/recombinase XerD